MTSGSRLALLTTLAVAASMLRPTAEGAAATCPQKRVSPEYAQRVRQALLAGRDIWGEALVRSPAGPTYDAARRFLAPLMLVGRPAGTGGRRLTDSGVYYLAFGQPRSAGGRGPLALHVAD